jgi:hypothetical protein
MGKIKKMHPFGCIGMHEACLWLLPGGHHLGELCMNRAIAIASFVVGAGFATTAWADSPNLKGSYAFTGEASCLVSPGHFDAPTALAASPLPNQLLPGAGFNARLQPNDITNPTPPAPNAVGQQSFTRSFSVFGVRTFDGQGHGRVQGTGVGIDGRPTPGPTGWPHFPPSAGSSDFSYDFTYTVDGNGGFTAAMVPGSYTETFNTGPRANPVVQTATVDAIAPVTGAISDDGKTLIVAHTTTTVETRTFSNGDVWPEICHRSRELIKLQNSDNDDDHGHDH